MKLRYNISLIVLVCSVIFLPISKTNADNENGYINGIFYKDGSICNWWADDGDDWYFFKDGKKCTGYGKDASGTKFFDNGKYASWWHDDGSDWYYFKDGEKFTGTAQDASGTHNFVNGKYKEEKKDGYVNGIFYKDGSICNWWADDGSDWYFFKDGKKCTGYGEDASGTKFFYNGKYASWWADDGSDWYFFKDGEKFTGTAQDASGTHNFVNGKYSEEKKDGYVNGIFYKDGSICNWWADDGDDWYYFKDGKKHTGYGIDASGTKFFYNGKYASWWHDDGDDWYYFKDGEKFTGTAQDASGTHTFLNGKYNEDGYSDGQWYISGENKYLKDSDGNIRTGFVTDSDGNLYFASKFANGAIQKNFFAYYNGSGYIFGDDGIGVETDNPKSEFIKIIAPYVVSAVDGTGLFPSVAIAQACLETGFGSSTLGYPPVYNLFGIKAPSRAEEGSYVTVWTTEYYDGNKVDIKDKFKKFDNYTEAFRYYAGLFTRSNWLSDHYRYVLSARTPQEACRALTGTYATDPNYKDKLLSIIDQYDLTEYDKEIYPNGEK